MGYLPATSTGRFRHRLLKVEQRSDQALDTSEPGFSFRGSTFRTPSMKALGLLDWVICHAPFLT
jgi:hypothetical protein